MGPTITIPLNVYNALVESQARVNVLIDLMNRDNSISTRDIYCILGRDEPKMVDVTADYDAKIKEL